VITEPCIGVNEQSCIEVCPVDCIHSDDQAEQYFINPDECIDCSACVAACPVEAIHPGDDLPEGQEGFLALNADYFRRRVPQA
jgi:NAD-dependent dihydropyrimidine dehydrogenase PreA subunit